MLFFGSWFLTEWTFDVSMVLFFKIVIEGFKSYREQIATEEFSPKVNCVGNNFAEKLLDVFFPIDSARSFEMDVMDISFMTCHDGGSTNYRADGI